MSKVIAVFFSPSETTKKVVNQIADNFEELKQKVIDNFERILPEKSSFEK